MIKEWTYPCSPSILFLADVVLQFRRVKFPFDCMGSIAWEIDVILAIMPNTRVDQF